MSEIVTPSIYVACLAAYNQGFLHGRWIDATQDADDIHKEIKDILETSPIEGAEEWAIHDYEGFGKVLINQYSGIKEVAEYAEFIEENPSLGVALLEHFSGDCEDAKTALDNYMGVYTSLAAYAEELTEETTQIPQNLQYYIDYESMARDMEWNGDVFTIEERFEEVHIFLTH